MAYREDDDLLFLQEMSSEDLDDLVDCLTKDKDGSIRLTEELTSSDAYKRHHPNHTKYWDLIAAELQCFGANSFATMFRGGKGVLYREVLEDVCEKTKVNFKKGQAIASIEEQLLLKIFGDAVEKMTDAERAEFSKQAGLGAVKTFSAEGLTAAALIAFKAGGFQSYRLTLFVVNAVSKAMLGRGLALAANASMARALGVLSGPVGWGLTAAWTAVDVAAPAFRVTLPAVVYVALLRKKHEAEVAGLWSDIEKELEKGR